jgi:hypothetical protein
LNAYKNCHRSNPRDKVYALIGLAQRKLRANSELIKKGENWIEVDYSKPALDIFRSLVLSYEAATGFGYYICGRVQWMQTLQTLQEVLDLRDSSDSNRVAVAKTIEDWGTKVMLGQGHIACDCLCYSVKHARFRSSPSWYPLTQEY